ncbi:DUF362 domain-containing protein [Candidatus Bathyarchaeota archaeon]|nr:MAG: DUF362 domain-containing protein [Candidatus Bathyarchaeota archaeon]
MKPVVALVDSNSHYDGVYKALKLIEKRIEEDLKGKSKLLIKPNLVSTRRQLSATHVDAVRAVIDVISKYYSGKIIVGEGPASSSLRAGLENFGYLQLQDEYNVEFVDLNEDEYVELEGFNSQMKPIKFRMSKTLVDSDYRISVALPKTHDFVITTLTIKNVVVGGLVRGEKWKIHQGYKAINLNIAKLAKHVMPQLGVIDGFVGMEGRGPISGDPVNLRVAAASPYPVSLDAVMCKIMGFNPMDIGYLHHLDKWGVGIADLEKIEIIGRSIEDFARKFKPHPNYREMLNWK